MAAMTGLIRNLIAEIPEDDKQAAGRGEDVRTPMNFQGGKAAFVSRARELTIPPMGGTRIGYVGPNMEKRLMPRPHAHFEMGQYRTDSNLIAKAMVCHASLEASYHFNPLVLPQELQEFYPRLPREAKQKILLDLIDNKTTDEVFDGIDAADMELVQTMKKAETGRGIDLRCPVSGCGLTISGDVPAVEVRAALQAHVHTMHPDWDGK